jgi:prepilin-type N-terminal cleavage/methylation domain-containing protein
MKKHTTLKSKFNSAFSLVELLVVIAVIAVIAAIAIPNIAGIRESAEGARAEVTAATLDRVIKGAATAKVGELTNYTFGAVSADGSLNAANAGDAQAIRAYLLTNGVLTAVYTNKGVAADGSPTSVILTNEYSITGGTAQEAP